MMICDTGDEASFASVIADNLQAPRAKSSEAAQTAHMRQVSNVPGSIAVLIAPRPSAATNPILNLTMNQWSEGSPRCVEGCARMRVGCNAVQFFSWF